MISLQQYLLDPCGTASIPYWKYKTIAVPQNMLIVNTPLSKARDTARFATVSGKTNDPSDPERLYRKCGFAGSDIWHILTPK